jgi:predicted ATPase/class 3 adenylate cyclase/Tfp pilus assembly protein PilF
MQGNSIRAGTRPPGGVLTLLFTDIEGSTRLWEREGPRMSEALALHDAKLRRAVEVHHGIVVKMIGDGMYAVFPDSDNGVAAAIDLQRALADPSATAGIALRVRCGLHVGLAEYRDGDYFGPPVNRAARIMAAAHGGQILVSQAIVDAVGTALPLPASLRDLGNVRLKDLASAEHVYQVIHPELRHEFPALRSLEAIPNNLPQQRTTLMGRTSELAETKRLLARSRILTLTGSGGCGKTRLALQVGADVLEQYPDGVWLVELAPLTDSALVQQALAATLAVKEEPAKALEETLVHYLLDKRLLLILDNCEHLLEAAARLADALLRRCPGVGLLTTSREALGITGEQCYRVPSLSSPAVSRQPRSAASIVSFEAVQLFVDRAALARTDFTLTDTNATAVASICARLDGIPLAIELAAARVRLLTPDEIDARLNERFRLLTGGARTALPRQQTLRSLIDWSYDLLDDASKRMLERVAVFAGGWTLDAAETVCAGDGIAEGQILELQSSLVDKSLVAVETVRGESRFRLVETVRQYAREKLLEQSNGIAVRDRHRDHFLALADTAHTNLRSAGQTEWLARLDDEYDNLRMALEWSLATAARQGLRLAGALGRYWIVRAAFSEGREWCARVLAAAGDGDSPEHASVHSCAGLLAYHQHDYAQARASLETSLALYRAANDTRGIAVALNNLGMIALDQGDLAAASALHGQSLALAREVGNRNGVARSLGNLGIIERTKGDYAAARRLFEEGLAILRELGDREGVGIMLHSLADAALQEGDWTAAGRYFTDSLTILRELEHRLRLVFSLDGVAALAAKSGDPACGARLWGAAQRLCEEIGAPAFDAADFAAGIAAARAALDDVTAWGEAWQDGRALELEQAIDLAVLTASEVADATHQRATDAGIDNAGRLSPPSPRRPSRSSSTSRSRSR